MLSKTIFAVAALSTLICAPAHAAKSTRSHTQKTLPPSKVPIASSIPASHLLGPSSVTWDAAQQGQFVISMTADKYGGLWAGSEDQGIWHLDPFGKTSNHWTQFTEKDGLGDNDNYALACDAKGRIWAGTLNHGVSVFNGKSWKNYDLADGPLGSHVFAIAVCPTDGDVWMATDAGLARYSLSKDTWSYYTRAEGLPSDQASALAFDKAGNIYVATQCDGLAIGSAVGGYHRWRQVRGSQGVPNAPSGSALPSDLTNAVLVARNGDIYVGTDCGLAWSWDGGASWHFVRGIDWQDKINGLAVPVQPVQAKVTGDVLLEDYVTALAQDASGRIYSTDTEKWSSGVTGKFPAIDTKYPYRSNNIKSGETDCDSPSVALTNSLKSLTESDSFIDYLMFMPSGTFSNWVPIGTMSWSYGGTANNPTNAAGGYTNSWVGTGLTPDKTGTKPVFKAGTTYPSWTDNVMNFGYVGQ